jgi:hypothetical protein
VADRTLDSGGIELLRDLISQPDRGQPERGPAHGG